MQHNDFNLDQIHRDFEKMLSGEDMSKDRKDNVLGFLVAVSIFIDSPDTLRDFEKYVHMYNHRMQEFLRIPPDKIKEQRIPFIELKRMVESRERLSNGKCI